MGVCSMGGSIVETKRFGTQEHIGERGQSIILLAFVFVSFLIIIGLAIDLGLVYIERVRLGRAVDAAALGGVQELPGETAAFARAVMFLRDNGYTCPGNTTIYFNDPQEVNPPICSSANAMAVIHVNTADYRELDEFYNPLQDTAMRIRVEGIRNVPLNFMKFAGQQFSAVPVGGRAVAENVRDLDVAVVFDRSGSMEFDTICYGCWEVDDRDYYDYNDWPSGEEYPNGGDRYPLAYPNELCSGYAPEDMYRTYSGYRYVVIEAEHFYNNWPIFNPDYKGTQSGVKTSYWGLQRNGKGASTVGDDPVRCSGVTGSRAGCGGYMQHNPFSTTFPEQVYDSSEIASAPQLIYRFQVPTSGTYRIWLRGQGGAGNDWSANVDRRLIHWGLNGAYRGSSTNFASGSYYDGATYGNWYWRRVDEFGLLAGQTYNLNIWAGGAGFRLDKIVITNAPDWMADDILLNPSYGTVEQRKGPAATAGLSGFACWPCYPLFGPPSSQQCQDAWDANPQWQEMYDAMFDDKQPVRAAKEAVKLFIDPPEDMESRLEPKFDQIGLVSYSSSEYTSIDSELECVKRRGATACTSFQSVLNIIETIDSGGSTSMASALWDGILVLMNGQEVAGNELTRQTGRLHYGRSGTSKFIILMTDGVPNVRPRDADGDYVACPDLYPDGGVYHDCVVYFAQKARDNGVIVYTIGLGEGVDEVLLTTVADTTGGNYYPAPDKDDLERIFMEILQQIYIRLVE
jgi:hypothetical protein